MKDYTVVAAIATFLAAWFLYANSHKDDRRVTFGLIMLVIGMFAVYVMYADGGNLL